MSDIFISYSSEDTNEAKEISQEARNLGLSVYCAGDDNNPGEKWEERVISELMGSWKMLVLLTPQSKNREWVISEWSLAIYNGVKIIPLLKDVKKEHIPTRLQNYQCCSYYKINEVLGNILKEKQLNLVLLQEKQYVNKLRRLTTTNETIYSPKTDTSPWTFEKYLELAKEEVFFCGQNLHYPLVAEEESCRKRLFDCLQAGKSVRFLICDFDCSDCVNVWAWVTNHQYRQHLKRATQNLQNWVHTAQEQGLQLNAKAVPFVPVSMTFVDCKHKVTSPSAKLVVTPNAFKSDTGQRPSIFFHKVSDEDVIKYYYLAYNERYKNARDIAAIDFSSSKSLPAH